eukprot:2880625-Amphidinium_carterae.2
MNACPQSTWCAMQDLALQHISSRGGERGAAFHTVHSLALRAHIPPLQSQTLSLLGTIRPRQEAVFENALLGQMVTAADLVSVLLQG